MMNIIQRASFSIFALFVISFLLFLLTNVVPGSPATAVLDVDASIEEIQSWERDHNLHLPVTCLLYTSPSPRDGLLSRMPSSA